MGLERPVVEGKGQKSRSNGGIRLGFEGGQTPLYRRLPKRGFVKKHAKPLDELNIGRAQKWIENGRLPKDTTITMKHLYDSGIVGSIKHGVKLLAKADEDLAIPVDIEVTRASKSAIRAVENAGGKIRSVYHSRLSLRALLKPEKFEGPPAAQGAPPPKAHGLLHLI